jgi:glucose/mannose-6-phosphate isomerase
MNTLDNLKQIEKKDPKKVLESIEMLGEQINQAWQEFKKVKVPKSYKKADKILINGMGGSGLGGHIVRSVFFGQLKLPVGIINSYQLPASLDKNSLYLISSYSGDTEEPISTLAAAKRQKAKIFGIGAGGRLKSWIKQKKIPGYVFRPTFNPSGQPRMGVGYSLGSQLGLFKKLGLIKISERELKAGLNKIDQLQAKFGVYQAVKNNPAKKLALELKDKTPIVIASEFLSGNAHTFANQINESAKTFSTYFLIPELNHHLLEGLIFPKTNQGNLFFIFLESKLYHSKNQARHKITQKVVARNKIKYTAYKLSAATKLEQALEMLLFSSYLSFYLAILNKVNPVKIPWVDYFKAQLKKYS